VVEHLGRITGRETISGEIFFSLAVIKRIDVDYLGGVCFRASFIGQFLVPT